MTTATAGLTASAIRECLVASGYRVTVTIEDAVVGEREVLGVWHALRRMVAQRNRDGSFRVGFLVAYPGQPGGPVYEHALVARLERCGDRAQMVDWLAEQDARPFPPKAKV